MAMGARREGNMAKSKELMAKNKRLSKEIESLKAADAAAAKKVAATEDYYKKQLRQHKQQDQQVEDQSDDDQQQKEAPPQRQQKKADPQKQQKKADPQKQQKKADPPQQQKKADPPQKQQKKADPPQPQKEADPPQDVASATLDYAYHKDGVGKAYKYWDSDTRTWGITPDYWAARQIGGDIWSVIWVWYSDGVIDHLLSAEEVHRYLP